MNKSLQRKNDELNEEIDKLNKLNEKNEEKDLNRFKIKENKKTLKMKKKNR